MNKLDSHLKILLMHWAGVTVHVIAIMFGYQSVFAQGLIDDVRQTIPVGVLVPFAGAKIDEVAGYWMLCDGREFKIPLDSSDPFWELFQVIGKTYGNSEQFRLPDLRGRIPVGRDDMGGKKAERITNTEAHKINGTTLGDSGGAETHQLVVDELPKHKHGGGKHSHKYSRTVTDKVGDLYERATLAEGTMRGLWTGDPTETDEQEVIKDEGGDVRHNNVQPSIILNYIIRYRSTR